MRDIEQLYPPSPAHVPQEFAAVSARYRVQVLLTLAALALFLACYLALLYVAFRIGLWVWNWTLPPLDEGYFPALVFKYSSLAAIGLFALFLLRPLFKWRRATTEGQVEITRESAPTLFAFLDRLCDEVAAPRPHRVLADHSVNAALVYDISLLNLLVPPKKQLLIGLGLVNVLNLSELKAVLAHEFGHFSQKSTWLGSYVYLAERVIHDLLFGRDQLDEVLEEMRALDLRLAILAWIVTIGLGAARWLLSLIYVVIMRFHRGLARQMEFNADDVAVSVSGSDAIVHALYKMEFATLCLYRAGVELLWATEEGVFTDDLFYHQTQLAERIRRRDPNLGLPPASPKGSHGDHRIFQASDDRKPDPYATHPTLYEREENAKRVYVECPLDERSAWLLFDNADALRQSVTAAFYRTELGREPVSSRPAAEVQSFIDAELDVSETLERYEGIFAPRTYFPCDPDQLPSEAVLGPERIRAFLQSWPDKEAIGLGKQYQELKETQRTLIGAVVDAGPGAEFVELADGERLLRSEVIERVRELKKQVSTLENELYKIERDYIVVHASIARLLDQAAAGEGGELARLVERVRVLHKLDRATRKVEQVLMDLYELMLRVEKLGDERDHSRASATRQQLADEFYRVRDELKAVCSELRTLKLPELPNIRAGTSAHELVVAPVGAKIPKPKGPMPEAEEFLAVWDLANGMFPRLLRVQAKAIATLVRHCERLAAAWREREAALPETAGTRDDQRTRPVEPLQGQ